MHSRVLGGETVRIVFERSKKYDDKYFGMGIGRRAESPVAYKLISAEISDELYGQPSAEYLAVHFESLHPAHDPLQESITMYKLLFAKGEDGAHLVSAKVSPDRALLLYSSNSSYDGSNFRNCISVGLW